MSNGSNLNKAKKAKNDEFYTRSADIEKELSHYKRHFKGKTVFCNCDDPRESNFVRYFSLKFEDLGLKKLIATHYGDKPYKLEYTGDKDGDNLPDPEEFTEKMIGDGDFRSEECIELLKDADVVVTNPPFSLFREYVAQLIKYKKKFLIIGNMNAITYKEIFSLIKTNRIWLGYTSPKEFKTPDGSTKKFGNILWFTNLDVSKRHDDLKLWKKYKKEYPKYDNYDAIEVSKVADIPKNYKGIMGVPITFLDKYNPDQFKILGIMDRANSSGLRTKKYTAEDVYNYNDLNARGVIKIDEIYKAMYARILILNKRQEV